MNTDRVSSSGAVLSLVREVAHEQLPPVLFCGHCGTRAKWNTLEQAPSRICDSCHLGLLLQAAGNHAPDEGDPFIVLDSSLSVCAVSSAAEMLLATRETDAVNRHVTELIVPADAEATGPQNLAVAVTWAARGDAPARRVTVRPANAFGIRMHASISSCGPPRAALVVFE